MSICEEKTAEFNPDTGKLLYNKPNSKLERVKLVGENIDDNLRNTPLYIDKHGEGDYSIFRKVDGGGREYIHRSDSRNPSQKLTKNLRVRVKHNLSYKAPRHKSPVTFMVDTDKKMSAEDVIRKYIDDGCSDIVNQIANLKLPGNVFEETVVRIRKVSKEKYETKIHTVKTAKAKKYYKTMQNIKGKNQEKNLENEEYDTTIQVRNNVVVLRGHVQSGKTAEMIRTAMKKVLMGESTLIVLNNMEGDRLQIKKRMDTINSEVNFVLEKSGHSHTDMFDVMDTSKFQPDDLEKALTGEKPRIIVTLGNQAKIREIRKVLERVKARGVMPYNVFIDEADRVDGNATIMAGELDNIKFHAKMVMHVSATVMDSLCDKQITQDRLFLMKPNRYYMGIMTYKRYRYNGKDITIPSSSKPCNRETDDPFKNDKNLAKFLRMFASEDPRSLEILNKNTHTLESRKVPNMALINIGRCNKPQKILFNYIKNTHPKIAVLLWNKDGVTLYHKKLSKKSIDINNPKCKYTFCRATGEHIFSGDVHISEIYQYLKDNGGVKKFPNIITVAGTKAGRGISFTSSDYGDYLKQSNYIDEGNNDYIMGWRQTHLYFIPSGCDMPELLQAAGRGCIVRKKFDMEPVCYITKEQIFLDTKLAAILPLDMILTAHRDMTSDKDLFSDAFAKQVIFEGKVPKGRKLTKRSKFTLNKTKNPNNDNMALSVKKYQKKCNIDIKIPEKYTHDIDQKNSYDTGEWKYIGILPDRLSGTKTILCSRIIDEIYNSGEWVDRDSIIRKLLAKYSDDYRVKSSVQADITRHIMRSVRKEPDDGTYAPGLNFRKDKHNKAWVMYKNEV